MIVHLREVEATELGLGDLSEDVPPEVAQRWVVCAEALLALGLKL